ncbi:MAG: hypothetical protein ACKVZ0_11860 [Gemmatimonadales bacterium]
MPPNDPVNPSIRQSKEALLEAAQAAIADHKNRPPVPPGGQRRGATSRFLFRLALVGLIATGAGVLALQPEWLTGPTLPTEDPTIQAASATLALVDVVSKIEAYTTVQGRLPTQLSDVGVRNAMIRYRIIGESGFEVSFTAGDTTVAVRSTDSLKSRMVEAIRVLQGRS